MSKRITVIGSTNVDFIIKLPHLPARGESVTDGTFMQTFGGKGANQAVAVARTRGPDVDVSFVTCLGQDMFAPAILANFDRDGIDTSRIAVKPGVATGTALIMLGGEGENYLAVAPGANFAVTPEAVDACEDLIRASAMVVLQMEIPVAATRRVLDLATKHGVRALLNYAPAQLTGLELSDGIQGLVVNEVEAQALCGLTVEDEPQARRAAEALLAKGPALVVLTLGPAGAYVAARDGVRAMVPTLEVAAVDTTAAGDTFCGALAVALVEGRDLLDAVRFANAAAAISVTRMGAQPSIPDRESVLSAAAERRARGT